MKLKDADVIREQIASLRVIVTGVRSGKGLLCELMTEYRNNILQAIDNAPTIDAVPVVRCKACKHWKKIREDRGLCKHPTFTLDDDVVDPITETTDFCSYGERRSDD